MCLWWYLCYACIHCFLPEKITIVYQIEQKWREINSKSTITAKRHKHQKYEKGGIYIYHKYRRKMWWQSNISVLDIICTINIPCISLISHSTVHPLYNEGLYRFSRFFICLDISKICLNQWSPLGYSFHYFTTSRCLLLVAYLAGHKRYFMEVLSAARCHCMRLIILPLSATSKLLTLTVLITTTDALRHFETG